MEEKNLDDMRHSTAHLLAAAVLELRPTTKNATGPSIEDGFYYDFDFGNIKDPVDLNEVEEKMKEILKSWTSFEQKEIGEEKARDVYSENPYKLELIDELSKKEGGITLVKSGNFMDLCRGGHIDDAKKLSNFKLLSTAGAYWRGDEKNKMLTRIYGTVFPTKKELDVYIEKRNMVKDIDHRKIGKDLDLFCFSELVGSGLPLFTPRGTLVRDILDNYIWQLRKKNGYVRVDIPHITKRDLFEKSGHMEKFGDELFKITSREGHEFVLKPMNCPHHIEIFKRKKHSYREMPIRYANTTKVYRDEQTGELAGLARVRSITQDDAHVFARESQINEELEKIWDMIIDFYTVVGFKDIQAILSLHDPKTPKKYLGDKRVWERAEDILRKIADKKQGKTKEIKGEAAFYGPKIDFMTKDSLGRKWQIATIQLDMVLPERFDATCTNEKGKEERIVLIHAAIAGAIERFLAVYLEHINGEFPFWLSPIQIAILPISEKEVSYAKEIEEKIKKEEFRTSLYYSNDTLGKKIRQVKMEKIPYYLVIGEKEARSLTVKVEDRSGSFSEEMNIDNFINSIKKEKR